MVTFKSHASQDIQPVAYSYWFSLCVPRILASNWQTKVCIHWRLPPRRGSCYRRQSLLLLALWNWTQCALQGPSTPSALHHCKADTCQVLWSLFRLFMTVTMRPSLVHNAVNQAKAWLRGFVTYTICPQLAVKKKTLIVLKLCVYPPYYRLQQIHLHLRLEIISQDSCLLSVLRYWGTAKFGSGLQMFRHFRSHVRTIFVTMPTKILNFTQSNGK